MFFFVVVFKECLRLSKVVPAHTGFWLEIKVLLVFTKTAQCTVTRLCVSDGSSEIFANEPVAYVFLGAPVSRHKI